MRNVFERPSTSTAAWRGSTPGGYRGPWCARSGIIKPMRDRFVITLETYARVALVALAALDDDRADGRSRPLERLGSRLSVWVHVTLGAVTWVAILWTAATAGRLTPRAADERE